MYVRLITYHTRPGVTAADARAVYSEMLRVMQPLPGFKWISLLLNEDTHQAISMSCWNDQACAAEAGTAILPLLMQRASAFVDRPPEVAGFELVEQALLTT
jgi:hypothetical protein